MASTKWNKELDNQLGIEQKKTLKGWTPSIIATGAGSAVFAIIITLIFSTINGSANWVIFGIAFPVTWVLSFAGYFMWNYSTKPKPPKEGYSEFMTEEDADKLAPYKSLENLDQDRKFGWIVRSRIVAGTPIKDEHGEILWERPSGKDKFPYLKGHFKAGVVEETHALVIGATGSGKTQSQILPNIEYNSRLHPDVKPSMIITDVKGEIFKKMSKPLKDREYRIIAINLRDTDGSGRIYSNTWNPLEGVFRKYTNKAVDEHGNIFRDKHGKAVFPDRDMAIEEAYKVVTSLIEVSDKDPFWGQSARSIVLGIIFRMLEDWAQWDADNIPEDQNPVNLKNFHFASVLHNLAKTTDQLKKWLVPGGSENIYSLAAKVAAKTIEAGDQTVGSILATANAELQPFSNPRTKTITSSTDWEFDLWTVPTAVFIIVPDEETSKHFLATMFFASSYQELVRASAKFDDKLPRPVLYLADEFANFPKIPDIGAMVSVSRSRNIFFMFIVQDISQLNSKYGQEETENLLANCTLHIFLPGGSFTTAKEYSERAGQKAVLQATGQKDHDGKATKSYHDKALITPQELTQLPVGRAMIFYSKWKGPYKAPLIRIWTTTGFDYKPGAIGLPDITDWSEVEYDPEEAKIKAAADDGQQIQADDLKVFKDILAYIKAHVPTDQERIKTLSNLLEEGTLSKLQIFNSQLKNILSHIEEERKRLRSVVFTGENLGPNESLNYASLGQQKAKVELAQDQIEKLLKFYT